MGSYFYAHDFALGTSHNGPAGEIKIAHPASDTDYFYSENVVNFSLEIRCIFRRKKSAALFFGNVEKNCFLKNYKSWKYFKNAKKWSWVKYGFPDSTVWY